MRLSHDRCSKLIAILGLNPKRTEKEEFKAYQKRRSFQNLYLKVYLMGKFIHPPVRFNREARRAEATRVRRIKGKVA